MLAHLAVIRMQQDSMILEIMIALTWAEVIVLLGWLIVLVVKKVNE